MSLTDVLNSIDAEIALDEKARKLLTGYAGSTGSKQSAVKPARGRKRTMSAAASKRIADAQRKRWAALRKAAK